MHRYLRRGINNFIIHDHYIYVAQGYTLRILDIAESSHPKEKGWVRLTGEIQSMAISGNVLYVGTSRFKTDLDLEPDGVKIFDLSNPAHPAMCATIREASRILMVKVMGSYLLVDCLGRYG